MVKCPFCGTDCKFKPGEYATHLFSENYSKFPVSKETRRYVEVVNPKCLYSYKDNKPVVTGHDYICKLINDRKGLTFPVTGDRIFKIDDPNSILKELTSQDKNMSAKENFQDFKHHMSKNALKNKLKEKKRLEKERKKNAEKENEKENTK